MNSFLGPYGPLTAIAGLIAIVLVFLLLFLIGESFYNLYCDLKRRYKKYKKGSPTTF